MAYFFGRRGTMATLVCVGLAHGVAVASMPPDAAFLDRWIDTMVGVSVVGGVVNTLAERNRHLVARLVADALLDPLTGLLNRRGFDERLRVEMVAADGALYAAKRGGRDLVVVAEVPLAA